MCSRTFKYQCAILVSSITLSRRLVAFIWAIGGTLEQITRHVIHKTKLNIYRVLVDVKVLTLLSHTCACQRGNQSSRDKILDGLRLVHSININIILSLRYVRKASSYDVSFITFHFLSTRHELSRQNLQIAAAPFCTHSWSWPQRLLDERLALFPFGIVPPETTHNSSQKARAMTHVHSHSVLPSGLLEAW